MFSTFLATSIPPSIATPYAKQLFLSISSGFKIEYLSLYPTNTLVRSYWPAFVVIAFVCFVIVYIAVFHFVIAVHSPPVPETIVLLNYEYGCHNANYSHLSQ